MSEFKRTNTPPKVQREVYQEAGGRCAVPTCRYPLNLDIAHMYPVSKGGNNDFMNLILLCTNCHERFDDHREHAKGMNGEYLLKLKKHLMVLNSRYCPFEIRILEFFRKNPDYIDLVEREIDVMYLVQDELIEVDNKLKFQTQTGIAPKRYLLTKKGKDFLSRWEDIESLNGVPRRKRKAKN